jgi:hypothetical protein
MASKTIDQLIINSPYSEPAEYWRAGGSSKLTPPSPSKQSTYN